jgi:hypothetical protein
MYLERKKLLGSTQYKLAQVEMLDREMGRTQGGVEQQDLAGM